MSVAIRQISALMFKAPMKSLLSLTIISLLSASAFADIQDPPMNDNGPTRKLGRGLANIFLGVTEIPNTICQINDREGSSTSVSYGVVKGIGRVFYRMHKGIYEVFTFPFATTDGSFKPPYKANVPWIHGGFEEFPPELGFQTKYRYTRHNYGW